MTGENAPSVVADEERLARFILFSKWIRNSDQTVRPDAFIPFPYPDLSVTRHLYLSEEAIWGIGQGIANTGRKTLYGRADFYVAAVLKQLLKVESDPSPDNPNHANIVNWPASKPAQKIIAQQLAADSAYCVKP